MVALREGMILIIFQGPFCFGVKRVRRASQRVKRQMGISIKVSKEMKKF
jgi:hypothetical protein